MLAFANIEKNFNFALKFQPQAFAGLTLIAWGQTLYYHKSVWILDVRSFFANWWQQVESVDRHHRYDCARWQLRRHGIDPHSYSSSKLH
jgi:hypothetical protein